jgi:hypothetical protein
LINRVATNIVDSAIVGVGCREPLKLESERPEVFAKNSEGYDLEVFPASSQILVEVFLDQLPPLIDFFFWKPASRFQSVNYSSPLFSRVSEGID